MENLVNDHWEITVLGVDPIVDSEVAYQNSFSAPLEEGNQFFLVGAKVKYLGTDSGRWRDSRLEFTGLSVRVYDTSY